MLSVEDDYAGFNTTTEQARNDSLESYPPLVGRATIYIVIVLVGTLGNALVILAIVLSRKLRTVTNWFVFNLAVADLLTSASVTFHAVGLLSKNGWPLPDWFCAVVAAMILSCLSASLVTHVFIGFVRWYLITQPKHMFRRVFCKRNVIIMVTFSWLYSLLWVVVPHLTGVGMLGYSSVYNTCAWTASSGTQVSFYNVLAGVGLLIILIVIITFYSLIYRFVARHNAYMASNSPIRIHDAMSPRTCDTNTSLQDNSLPDIESQSPQEHRTDDNKTVPITNNPSENRQASAPNAELDYHDEQRYPGQVTGKMSGSDPIASTSGSQGSSDEEAVKNQDPGHMNAHSGRREPESSVTDKSRPTLNRHSIAVTKRLAFIVLVFFVCFIPYGITVSLFPGMPVVSWILLLLYTNSFVNPLIYWQTMPPFREAMRCILRCRLADIPVPVRCIRRRV